MKLGVYIASHKNAIFLRHCLAQIMLQSRKPDVVAIYENGHPVTYMHLIADIVMLMRNDRIAVRHQHTAEELSHPHFHSTPLKMLLDDGCDLYTKWDHDDFFYVKHLEKLEDQLLWEGTNHCSIAVNQNSDQLVQPSRGYGNQLKVVDFASMNPVGGMSDCAIFTRDFACRYYDAMMDAIPGTPDDVVMAQLMDDDPKAKLYSDTPTACYVMHGSNTSMPLAALYEQQRQDKALPRVSWK